MTDPDEIRGHYEATTDSMRQVLDELARHSEERRTNSQIETALGWEALSVRGSAAASIRRVAGRRSAAGCRTTWRDADTSESGGFELWMDSSQAAAIRSAG
jgi:hypothetical protein